MIVVPDTDLVDQDLVTIEGRGFPSFAAIGYCQGIIDATPAPNDCGHTSLSTTADEEGEFAVEFSVRRLLTPSSLGGAVVDCAQPTAACGIGATAVSDLQIVIAPLTFLPQDPFTITGTVEGPGGDPLADVDVWAYRAADGFVGSVRTVTDPSGAYELEVAPAVEYRVRFGPPPGSALLAEWFDDAPGRAAATPVLIPIDGVSAVADARLDGGGAITGSVEDPSAAPVAGARVWGYAPTDLFFGSVLTITGADGSYRLDVRDGDYLLRIQPPPGSGLLPEWYDDAAKRTGAAAVTVPAGQTVADVDVVLAAP